MAVVVPDRPTARSGRALPAPLALLGDSWPLLAAGLWLGAAILLAVRRLCGAVSHPLSTAALCLAAIVLTTGCEWLRRQLTSSCETWHVPRESWLGWSRWIPGLAAWITAAAISMPGSYWPGPAVLWTSLTAALTWAIAVERRAHRPHSGQQATATNGIAALPGEPLLSTDDALPANILQQIVRRQDPDGSQWITGQLRVQFTPGQRTAHAHVAFCPPLSATPDCEAETISGPDAQLTVGQVLPQGARFDVRLDEAADTSADVLLEFAAHLPPGE